MKYSIIDTVKFNFIALWGEYYLKIFYSLTGTVHLYTRDKWSSTYGPGERTVDKKSWVL